MNRRNDTNIDVFKLYRLEIEEKIKRINKIKIKKKIIKIRK